MILKIQQNTLEWTTWRKGRIGASNAAAILGICNYQTPYGLWLEMTGRKDGFQGNIATQRGIEIEPKARASYEILHADFVEMNPVCVEHQDHPKIIASLDGLSPDRKKILEIKYPSLASHNLALSGVVPEHYMAQCQHQLMLVPEAESCDYWSYREGDGALVTVKPNREFQDKLLKAELAFLELVRSDIPPPLSVDDDMNTDNPEIRDLCDSLLEFKSQSTKHAKDMVSALKIRIIKTGGHNRIRCGRVLVTHDKRTGTYRAVVSR